MTVTPEQAALLALLRVSRSRWGAVADEIEERGSALAVLHERNGQMSLLPGDDAPDLDAAMRDISAWEAEGIHFSSFLDEDYPSQLLTIHQRPPFITWRGHPDRRDAQGIAVVGTRQASPEGIESAREMAGALARAGVPVISGLAQGIDTAAHEAALAAGGRTAAIIGTGLRVSFPAANRALQERIATEGVVLSQFYPSAPPTRTSFLMRNAVMSGYAAGTVVIEAGYVSGARSQARLALEHGRPIFLMASLRRHDWARDYASRPGARFVDSAEQVVAALRQASEAQNHLVWA